MIAYFADRYMHVLGMASTLLPESLSLAHDEKVEDVETGVKTFEFDLLYEADRKKAELMTTPGNYLLRSEDGEAECYTIIDAELDRSEGTIHIYAEDAGLDLINEVVGAYTASGAMTVAQYVSIFMAGTGFEVGVNEVSTYQRTLSWEGESTLTERMQSVATQFDAEMSFSYTIDKLQIVHRYINFWRKRGKEIGTLLRVGEHISNLRIHRSVADLATGLLVEGGRPKGSDNPITLSGYSYDDGDIYVSGRYVLCRSALAKWARNVPGSTLQKHIIKTWSYDTTSQATLCSKSVAKLKQICDMQVTYEADVIELPENVQVGDTVRVVDTDGDLYLETRVLKLVTKSSEGRREVTLGDYLITDSGLSDRLTNLASAFSKYVADSKPETVFDVITSYTLSQTVLTAKVYRDRTDVTHWFTADSFEWFKKTENVYESLGTGYTITIDNTTMGYGGTIVCRFQDEEEEA